MSEIIVIGAGIAGLTTAVTLRAHGRDVRVLERDNSLRPSGTAVILQSAAISALERIGLGPALASAAVSIPSLTIRNRRGRRLTPPRSVSQVLAIDRPSLVDILASSLPHSAIEYGRSVTPAEVSALSDAGHPVVGADGVHSSLRTAAFGSEYAATYSGATIWRGTTVGHVEGLVEYWSAGRRFGLSERPGGVTNWYASARCEQSIVGSDGEIPRLHRLFHGWNDRIDAALANISGADVLQHNSFSLVRPLPSFNRGSLALIGDAAHGMTPDLGRGANEAIADGAFLGHALATFSMIGRAYEAYNKERRAKAQRIARVSSMVNSLVHRTYGGNHGK